MAGLTQPLEFRKHLLCTPKRGFDVIPFVDAVLIALFVALNASVFVLSPGTAVQLPVSGTMESAQDLPTAVLTVDRNELYFFEGRKLATVSLETQLTAFMENLQLEDADQGAVLLLKADASITSETLFKLMDIARSAGFTQVHLAAEPLSRADSPWEEGDSGTGP
jgi:biopolymer transport protein ExbD